MKLIFGIFIFLVAFSSCVNSSKKRQWEEYVVIMIDRLKKNKVVLPDSITIFDKSKGLYQKHIDDFNSCFRLVTFIDVSCSVCLNNFSYWNKFIDDLKTSNYDCDFLFFVNTDHFNCKEITDLGFCLPFIVDSTNQFVQRNEIWDKRFQTMLITRNNDVLIVGDPTVNKELGDYYRRFLLNPDKFE